jgi:periplasmic protein TonB
MFESSLIDLEARQPSRRRWAALPVAIALHGAVLVSVGVAQVWNVEALNEPPMIISDTFVPEVVLVEQPAAPPDKDQTQTTSPRTPQRLSQPEIKRIPDVPADLEPKTSTGPAVLDGPADEGGDEKDLDLGSFNGSLRGPIPGDRRVPVVAVAPPPPQDEILTVGGAVTRPELRSGSSPRYSKIALRARIEGVVVLRAIIDERGFVTNVHILKGLPMGLDQAAVETVREWIFEPAKLAGQPVKVYYTLTVQFRL